MIKYKTPWHIRQYVKRELMDYQKNKLLLQDINKYNSDILDTKGIILASRRIAQIETVLQRLNEEDRQAAEIIFIQHYGQVGAEVAKGLSKNAYYNAMNKVIYLTAIEMELM